MILNGRALKNKWAERLLVERALSGRAPSLGIFMVGDNPASAQFVSQKVRLGAELGVEVVVCTPKGETSTASFVEEVAALSKAYNGVVVQLPLPPGIDTQAVLDAVPVEKDVDCLSSETSSALDGGAATALPAVVSAMRYILEVHNISLKGKRAAVIGSGRLVGAPALKWLRQEGADVSVSTRTSGDIAEQSKEADIIVLGAGVPGLLTPDMVREGVVILDAGTSEDAGTLKGDADPACAEKASLFTPVPGGIGPLTVVALYANLSTLAKRQQEESGIELL